MADVFVSHASANRKQVHLLAVAFGAQVGTVWWDREIRAGTSYRSVIAQALAFALTISVIISKESAVFDWAIDEANEKEGEKDLFPALIGAYE